jgi:hypothetical protein
MSLSTLISKLSPTRAEEVMRNRKAILWNVWCGKMLVGYCVTDLDKENGKAFSGVKAWDEAVEEMKRRGKAK